MANDAGNHPQNSSDVDMTGDHADFDAVQLAQADAPAPKQGEAPAQKTAAIPAVPNGTVHVEVPAGEKVVRVAVANGETVILPQPFDDAANLAAKEGNGNLAIKVGDITVILEGYQQTLNDTGHPVVLKDEQGDTIDVAVVLASTDPNLDITTAAGPAAGAQGADNTGALLSQFGGAAGLGGLNAVGVLDQTELQYGLIDNAILRARTDALLPDNPVTVTPPPPPGPGDDPIKFVPLGTAVFESALAKGSDAGSPNEQTSGTIHIDAKDGVQTITVGGVTVDLTNPAGTPTIPGHFGDVKITGWDPATGDLTYTYTLTTNDTNHPTPGKDVVTGDEDFPIVATDKDGDSATGTLEIGIVDDVPTANNDTDLVAKGTTTATGNVITGADTTEGLGGLGHDIKGADGAAVSKLVGFNGSTDSDASDGLTVDGQYGKLTMKDDGTYSYTRDPGTPGGVSDTFTYTLKDGDGDTSTATLTINVEDDAPTLHVPTAAGQTTVDEKGLPAGSGELADGNAANDSDKSEKVSGSITYTEGDGPAAITIQGKDGPVTATKGADIVGADGTLHIDSVVNGVINYTYTLTTNTSGDATHDDFKVSVTDKDGDKANDTLVINIVDDVPTAKNDTDTVDNATNTATGNVITGANTTEGLGGAGTDVKGADGATVSKLVGFNGSTDSDASDGLTVDGQYGKLTMNADGTYTYVRDPGSPGNASETFTYTLKDGDGDTSTATLTVGINDKTPTVHVPTADGETQVNEKGLPAGSGELADGNANNNSDKSEAVTGNITYTDGDAPAAITIQGKNGPVTVTAGADIVGADGTLHINSVVNGVINYTYTLTTNTSGDATHDDFKVSITDKDGDNATDTLVIKIVDDVPTAKADTDLVSNTTNTATGNVITGADTTSGTAGADVKGADGATVSGLVGSKGTDTDASNGLTVKGDHGTLVMQADGTYTYTRDDSAPLTATDTFKYTLKDGDGDTSETTLTIDIKDNPVIVTPPPPPGPNDDPVKLNAGGTAVFESALSDGSNPTSDAETTKGTVKITALDGVSTVTVDGVTVNLADVSKTGTIHGTYGDLTVTGWDAATGTLSYTYTLTDNDPNHTKQGNDVLPGEEFTVVATDKDGDQSSGNIDISIVDDVPIAKNDTDGVDNATNTATGNVITGANTTEGLGGAGTDVKGADGATVSKLVGFNGSTDSDASDGLTVDGQYGKLTMNADGTYTYVRDPGSPSNASETFTYTLKDGDGDTSTATLTVGINDKVPTVHVPTADGETQVNEKGLPAGSGELADGNANNNSDKSEAVTGNITYTDGDAPAAITIQGKNGPVTVTAGADIVGADGTLHINSVVNGVINYTYTLTTNTSGDATHDDFKVSITDKDGDNATDTLVIKIVDDVPTAKADTDLVSNTTNTATGNVITGADTTSGTAGADVKGADGATVSGLVGSKGTDTDASNGLTVKGDHGTLVMQADGTYTYTRDDSAPLTATETFKYTLKDGDGDTSETTLTIDIKDNPVIVTPPPPPGPNDDPVKLNAGGTAVFESALSDGSNPTSTAETTKGVVTVVALDGVSTVTVAGITVNLADVSKTGTIHGTYGDLTVTGWNAATGELSYSYTLKDNDPNHTKQGNDVLPGEEFTVVATDKDGDQSSGNIDISIVDDVPTAKNDTDAIDNATNTATGNVVTGADTTSGAGGADVKGADGATVSKLVGFNGSTDSDASDGLTVDGQYGKLTMNADGTYTYTRDAGTPGGVSDTFTYTLKDGDGDTSTATLTLGINDKTPTVHVPTADGETQVNEKGLPAGSGELADGNANNNSDKSEAVTGNITYTDGDAPAAITIQGKNGPVTVTAGADIVGADGTLHINSVVNGVINYTYTLTTNTSGDATHDDFKVSITDKDGDNATDTLVIKIVDDVPTAKADTDLVSNTTNTATGNVITGADTTSGTAGADVKGADGATVSGLVGSKGTDTDASNGLTVKGDHGTLVMQADGTYTYTRDDSAPLTATETFTYTLKDGDGDTSPTTLTINIDDHGTNITDLTPKANGGDVTVDEGGLSAARGPGESAGSDGVGATNASGDFSISAPDGVKDLSIDGHSVISNGVFAATSFTTGFGNTLNVTGYDANTGKVTYNYTLNDNESHPSGNGQNSLYEDLNVKLTDKDGDTANGTLSVNIIDDVPQAANGTQVMGTDPQKNNVLLILDTTGSMDVPYPTSTSSTNKLQFEVQAAKNLLDAYLAAGGGDANNVRVQIVTFSVDGHNQTTQWVSVATAEALLNGIGNQTPSGNTNYDAGIASALNVSWTSGGAISGANNTAYFFSDGLPNENDDGVNGLNGAQKTAWINRLEGNDINAYAIGMIDASQTNPNSAANALGQVAYDGRSTTPDDQKDTGAIIVTDPNSLTAQIVATIGTKSDGNLIGDLGGKYGADGPGDVHSITLNGKTYTFNGTNAVTTTGNGTDTSSFNAATHVLTITNATGTFTVDMDTGAYTYQAKGGAEANLAVGWTLVDSDGDVSNGGTLYLLAPVPAVSLAADTHLPTQADYDASHTKIFGGTNDTINGSAQGDYIDGGAGNDTMKGGAGDDLYIVGSAKDQVVEKFDQGIDTIHASVSHTLEVNVENLVLTGSDNISGTGNDLNNTMIGNSGDNTLDGGAGNDILTGGAGSDTMKGGDGNDQFLHVDSNDLSKGGIDGGAGDDLVDLSSLATFKGSDTAKIDNVEVLSFNGGAGTAVTLDYNSVLGMTDANHNLVIHGDKGSDSVALSGGFTKIGADITANDGLHYDIFQAGTGPTQVTVFVDHNLNATAN